MTPRIRAYLLWAVLVAALLSFVIRVSAAERKPTTAEAVIMEPDICRYLEPYTWWWGFFGCEGE